MITSRVMFISCWLLAALAAGAASAAEADVQFDRDIRPILSNKCFQCHGPDEANRKAKLRLDVREAAISAAHGTAAVVPGKPEQSLLYERIISRDEDERMPPAKSNKKLSEKEIELLRRWIAQGAPWAAHWSLVPPKRSTLPTVTKVQGKEWARNEIDPFVLEKLNENHLKPAPEADRRTLLRRLSLDLTGLPPTWEETEAFVGDASSDWYEKTVNRLLASPHFGERLAMVWLDAARYSDTDGFQQDATRNNWPWRDWVIQAFNANMPYDRFTIEQFAGDLLPNAKPDQILATAFHRNHMTNGEGGRDPEESRIDYVMDRVQTMGTLWLGLTLNCTQCHTHKYDPITHAEYYQFFAFFNSIDENGQAGNNAKPYLKVESQLNQDLLATAQQESQRRKATLDAITKSAEPAFVSWLAEMGRKIDAAGGYAAWEPVKPHELRTTGGAVLVAQEDGSIKATGPDARHEDYLIHTRSKLPRLTGLRLDVLHDPDLKGAGLARSDSGHFIATGLKVSIRSTDGRQDRPVNIMGAVASFAADKKTNAGFGPASDLLDDDPRSGWASHGSKPEQKITAVFAFEEPQTLAADEELLVEIQHRSLQGHQNIGRFSLALTADAGPATRQISPAPLEQLAAIANRDLTKLPVKLRDDLRTQYLADHEAYRDARELLDRAEARVKQIRAATAVDVMVLKELAKPRLTHRLLRGEWDKKGETVEPGVPAALSPWPDNTPRNRLGLAMWLTDQRNPLTARVTVNLLWQTIFGGGLVRTPEDFGAQGEQPTHPALLDHLAIDLVEHQWDLRRLIRLMVTSAAYRQSSNVSPELLALDPDNRLLARANRFRLPSWMLRDSALKSSGLLNPALGGPPVKPYHPDGVWEDITMGRFKYDATVGPDQYRRTIYAFWRRTAAPVFLFDNAQRRVCEVRTLRTNTPLHALTLMNDLTYLEASRALAATIMQREGTHEARLTHIVRQVLTREPTAKELTALSKLFDEALAHYRAHPDAARDSLEGGQWQSPAALSKELPQLASYALVASAVFNFDEALNRE